MKKRNLIFVPAMAMMTPTLVNAQATLQPDLAKVAKKVDTDGTYLQLNKFDDDLAKLEEYGALILDIIKKEEADVPAGLDVKKLIEIFGVKDMKAMAASSKKVDGAWNNRSYIWTGGSKKGILSFNGGANEKFSVADFAPETTDIAFQTRLDLRQAVAIFNEVMVQMGQEEQAKQMLEMKVPQLGGMTPAQLVSKLNFRVNVAIDINTKERFQPEEGIDLPSTDAIIRIDGVAWAWDQFMTDLIKESGVDFVVKQQGKVTTYTMPEEMAPMLQGYSPVIRVDREKNLIWVASKESVLTAALGEGKKLKDGAGYKKTMATLPKEGNTLFYVSKDLINETVAQYNAAEKNGLLNDADFQKAKPLVDKLIKDLTAGDSGIAFATDVDKDGINSVIRLPFPVKNYLQSLSPLFSQAAMFGAMAEQRF